MTITFHGSQRAAATVLAVATSLGLAACGSDDSSGDSGAPSDKTITLQSAFGEAEYPVNPERVVVTASAVDNLLALGVTPTAVVLTPQDENMPWRDGKLDGVDKITVGSYGDIDVEKIAAAHPDVIIGDIYWIESQEKYDKLSAIAPTLNGPSADPAKATWVERLTQLGELYDRADGAQKAIDDDAALFSQTKADMPGLAGKTGWIGGDPGDGSIGISTDPNEGSNRFLYDLGMKLPDTLKGKASNTMRGSYAVYPENFDQLAADFSVMYTAQGLDAMKKDQNFAKLPQVLKGTMVDGGYAMSLGMAQPSSLVRSWAIQQLHPTLEKVAS